MVLTMTRRPPIDPDLVCNAVASAIALAGSQQKLAAACGVTQPSISKAKLGGRVSAVLALAIHRATGGAVSACVLRPDLWRRPDHVPTDDMEAAPVEPASVAR
jgi:DNA-binding transcriptional regulator YdaS (Cro superfamily)